MKQEFETFGYSPKKKIRKELLKRIALMIIAGVVTLLTGKVIEVPQVPPTVHDTILVPTPNNQLKEDTMPEDVNQNAAIIAQSIDSATNSYLGARANAKNRKFAKQMYERQRQDALADWNMQNAYNAPAAQMARLREAGLNPNLVYGDGGSLIQAATVRNSDMTYGGEQPLHGTTLGDTLSQYYNTKLQGAAVTTAQKQQALLDAQIAKTIGETNINAFNLDRLNELKVQIVEEAWANTNLKKAQIDATVHGNQRANQLQAATLRNAENIADKSKWEANNAYLQNAMQKMQNNQYEQMSKLELLSAKAGIMQLIANIQKTQQETKNSFEVTRLNKMEADAGRVLHYLQGIIGTAKGVR